METRKQSKTRDGLPAETLSRGGAKDLRSIREQVAQHLLDYPSNMQRCIREQLAIQQNILGDPALLDGPNYRRISSRTLQRMFVEYDERFFLGQTQRLVEFRQGSLDFRLSKRMTRTGGKTTRIDFAQPTATGQLRSYEITLSSHLLFQAFKTSNPRPELVSGVRCRNRLEATQRIFEHEMLHLLEMLLWVHSSCAESRFKRMARRLFGHTQSTHQLPTRGEVAKTEFGLAAGQWVEFTHEGKTLTGFVNRIGQRATVLVKHAGGELYSDGFHYQKFYVPLKLLARSQRKSG
jgi:hypothetical protein